MKITAALQPQIQGRNAGSRPVPTQAGNTDFAQRLTKTNNAQARQVLQNVPSENSLSNAMVIMNKARAIIQQALSVSGRLRSEAALSMTSGNVNQAAIGREIASLNTSFGEFSTSVTVPAIRESITPETVKQMNNNITQLQSFYERKTVPEKEIATVDDNFRKINTQLEKQIEAATEKLQRYADSYKAEKPDIPALAGQIRGNFNSALLAQGNISGDNAAQLLS